MVKKIGLFCLVLILVLAILPSRIKAQGLSNLESRISTVEADNFQLRSRLDRIESQLARLTNRSLSSRSELNRPAPLIPSRLNRQRVSADPMFDRLATLVIELKERVNALEAQVAELKRQQRKK